MTHPGPPAPRQFLGVMVSSTFTDFERHREALIAAVSGQALHPIAMEQDSALPGETVIESSLWLALAFEWKQSSDGRMSS